MNVGVGMSIAALTVAVVSTGLLVHQSSSISPERFVISDEACRVGNPPELTAKTGIVLNLADGEVLYDKGSARQVPLASLTKVMTALVASLILDPNDDVTISADALTPLGDAGLVEGEVWRAQDLIDFTLITSANDGARALLLASIEKTNEPPRAFVDRMNALASSLGLTQTYFLNETGLDVTTSLAGAYGSAADIATLLGHLYREAGEVAAASSRSRSVFTSRSGIEHYAENTSTTAGHLPGQVVSKTGFTDLAGGNLGIVAEPLPGKPVAIVVLSSTREERERDVVALYEYARKNLRRATLCHIQ